MLAFIQLEGLIAALLAVGFLAVTVLGVITLLVISFVRRRRGARFGTPGVVGSGAATFTCALVGLAAVYAAQHIGTAADETAAWWAPGGALLAVVIGLVVHAGAKRRAD